jgi:hypothetical protein
MLQFRGSVVTSDAGLLAYRQLDDTSVSVRWRRTSSSMHVQERTAAMRWRGLLRQAVFGRLAGCEDVNDAERLRDVVDWWRQSGCGMCRIGEPDGPLRDALACGRTEYLSVLGDLSDR